ncbi:MAG: hypothetical protein J6Y02_12475 [Pseudobutyrivibrio sp.]|nr:hypothetical protein [Pseudobutyrivibrio sp.]
MNRSLDRLKSLLDKEIDKVVEKGEVAPAEIKPLGEIVDIYKDIETICAMEEYKDTDESYAMSNRGYSSERMSRYYPERMYRGSYDYAYDDMSYNDRMSNARGMNSRDNYSRHSEKEEMISKLEMKLKNAKTPQERESIMECIRTLEG